MSLREAVQKALRRRWMSSGEIAALAAVSLGRPVDAIAASKCLSELASSKRILRKAIEPERTEGRFLLKPRRKLYRLK